MFAYRKWIGRLLYIPAAIICAGAFAYRYRVEYEAMDAPLQPWVDTGHIIPWAREGAVHFITVEQAHALSASLQTIVIAIAIFFIGIFIEVSGRVLHHK